jgi:hypothetical protein
MKATGDPRDSSRKFGSPILDFREPAALGLVLFDAIRLYSPKAGGLRRKAQFPGFLSAGADERERFNERPIGRAGRFICDSLAV